MYNVWQADEDVGYKLRAREVTIEEVLIQCENTSQVKITSLHGNGPQTVTDNVCRSYV